MREVTAGARRYRVHVEARGHDWCAYAESIDLGERFGPDMAAASDWAASERVARWLGWQAEHAIALEALQQAERSYHRAIAGHAFGGTEAGSPESPARALLEEVDAARRRLDAVRARHQL